MPRITDPALRKQLGIPPSPAMPQASGLAPPSGYHRLSPTAVAPDTNGPQDIATIKAQEAARSWAGMPADVAKARALAQIQLDTERQRQNLLAGVATLDPKLDQLTGDDFLKALPSQTAATVQALADGRMAFPAGAALKSPYWQQMLASVAHYDPQFDAVNYNARAATRRDFTSGVSARNIRALNTAIGHLGQLNNQVSGTVSLGGFPFARTANMLGNAYKRQEGDAGITNFDQTATALASELTQVFRGSGGAEADVKRYIDELSSNGSKDQKEAAVKNIAGLLRSRIEAVGDSYQKGMGKTIDPLHLLDQHAQDTMTSVFPPDNGGNGQNGGGTGGNPTGGAPGGGVPSVGALPGATLSTSGTHAATMDPKTAAIITSMIGQHMTADEMNRILVPAGLIGPQGFKQDDIDKYQKTLAAGGKLTAAYEEPNSTWQNIASTPVGVGLLHGVDAATGGTTDEAAGLIDWARGKGSLSDLIASHNADKQGSAAADPRAAFWGGLGGNVVGMAGAGKLLGGTALATQLGRWAPLAGNAAWGGLEGMGQDNNNRMLGGVGGSLAGTAGYGIGAGLAIPANALLRTGPGMFVANQAKRMFGSVPGVNRFVSGAPILPAPGLSPAEQAAAATFTKAGPADILGKLDEADRLGMPFTIADTAPDPRELAAAAVRRSPTASSVAENVFIPRNRAQIDRLTTAVGRDLGPTADIPQLSKSLAEQAQRDSAPLYARVFSQQPVASPEIDALLQTPFGQDALKSAQRIAANKGEDTMGLGFLVDKRGNVTLSRTPRSIHNDLADAQAAFDDATQKLTAAQGKYAGGGSAGDLTALHTSAQDAAEKLKAAQDAVASAPAAGSPKYGPGYKWQTLDHVKQGMDDVLEQYRNPITGKLDLTPLGESQNAVRSQFLTNADVLSPDYAAARAAYGGPMQSKDALWKGKEAFKLTPDELRMQVGNQSNEQLGQMQLGFRSDLMNRANNVRDASSPWDSTLGNPNMRARVDILHPGNPGTDDLFRSLDMERQMSRTANDIIGNSKTAQRQIADESFAGSNLPMQALNAGLAVKTGGLSALAGSIGPDALRTAWKLGVGKRAVAKADELAPLLMNPDPAAAAQSVDDILKRMAAAQAFRDRTNMVRPIGMFGSSYADALASGY